MSAIKLFQINGNIVTSIDLPKMQVSREQIYSGFNVFENTLIHSWM